MCFCDKFVIQFASHGMNNMAMFWIDYLRWTPFCIFPSNISVPIAIIPAGWNTFCFRLTEIVVFSRKACSQDTFSEHERSENVFERTKHPSLRES
jgi:hypothetical protein